jgi:aryl-alcohol dehydrogenase-like predicted oxidoreductase
MININTIQYENNFSRRNFLQTAAVGATAALLPTIADASNTQKDITRTDIFSEMPKRRLGRTNRMVSCIGFGGGFRYCNWVADDRMQQKLIDYAIQVGITYWDSARMYGNGICEERYGKFLTPKYRNQIFLNSKTLERSYDGVMKDIETSLKTLKTNHLDLYCMHGIDDLKNVDALLSPTGGYKAFLKLKSEGVVKNIGFSYHKWNDASQKCFQEFDVDAVLCPINASKFTGNEDNLMPIALKRDIGIIAIKILGQNALIGNVTGDDLIRYTLSLPVSVANVGMDGFPSLESTAKVGKEPVISKAEAQQIHIKLNFDHSVTRLPYFVG